MVSYDFFFPYEEYRNEQQNVIEKINLKIGMGENVIFSAPNGTGKTIDNLSATIPLIYEPDSDKKIIYLCRTHTQNARVIKEINSINEKINKLRQNSEPASKETRHITAISLRGRAEMCLNPTIRKIKGASPNDIMNICSNFRKNRSCSFFNNMRKSNEKFDSDLNLFSKTCTDAQIVIEYCKESKYCPYFFTKLLLKSVSIIVANYNWIFNPYIRDNFLENAEIELNKSIIIIDECHNLSDMATQIGSVKLTQYAITQCLKDLEYGRASFSMIDRVKCWNSILTILGNKIGQKDEIALEPKGVLMKYLRISELKTVNELKSFLIDLENYGNAIMEEKLSSGANPINFVESYIKFMRKFIEVCEKRNYYFAAVKNKKRRSDSNVDIEITCLDPRETTDFVYNESYATLNCSGTIHPDSYKEIMGFTKMSKGIEIIEVKSPFPKKNINVLITENINTRGNNRTDSTYAKMCKKIAEVLFHTPANVGIFCASYNVLEGLKRNGIEDLVKFSGKKFYIENYENTASDNAILIEKYKSDSKNNGAVLLGVAGGRNSEGEDFPGDLMNAVIIAGFPFARPTPRIEAKIEYYNTMFNGKGRLFAYTIPAIRRSNQAAGRPIRKLSDKGIIVLMDDRFKYYLNLVSSWIRENAEIIQDKPNMIAKHVEGFFDT